MISQHITGSTGVDFGSEDPTAGSTGDKFGWAPPIIDLGDFLSEDPNLRSQMVRELRKACESTGFFYLANHGISESVTKAAVTATKTFFALPQHAKMEVHTSHSLVTPKTSRGFISYKNRWTLGKGIAGPYKKS